jgi:hypothetical protein
VTQAIGTLPGADDGAKAELARLVAELRDLLAQVPPEQAAEADAVATLTGELIDKAGSEPRNPALLKSSADALLSSAGRLADRCKPVLNVVE